MRRSGAWSLDRLLSGDRPGTPLLSILLVLLLAALALAPFLFPGTRSVAVAARICTVSRFPAMFGALCPFTVNVTPWPTL